MSAKRKAPPEGYTRVDVADLGLVLETATFIPVLLKPGAPVRRGVWITEVALLADAQRPTARKWKP